jgi:hypothetical protein
MRKRGIGRMKSKLDKIIEDATVDAYNEIEQFAGWYCLLENEIKVPQECTVRRDHGVLTKIIQAKSGHGVYAEIRFNTRIIPVPIEMIRLKNKHQDTFIEAYKKWL